MSDARAKLMSCVIKLNPYCFLVAVAVVVDGSFSKDDGDGNQAPVVQTLDSAIQRINHYPADSVIDFRNTYPLDSDLSGGERYPTFEQPGPGRQKKQ